MIGRAAAVVSAAVLVLGLASSASAQELNDVLFALDTNDAVSANPLSQTVVPATLSGAVAVEYHGSASAGCAALGVCAVSGTTTWDPGRQALLSVTRRISRGKRKLSGYFSTVSDTSPTTSTVTTAEGGHTCSDVVTSLGAPRATTRAETALELRLVDPLHPDLLATRCAGPIQSELVKLLPVRPLPRSVLRHGTRTVDLSTVRPFSSGGFAGTLRSTVRVKLGPVLRNRPSRELNDSLHIRIVRASYRVAKVEGSLALAFHGDPAACADLDACGRSGTMTVAAAGSGGEFGLQAFAYSKRPWVDLLAAAQLSPAGNAHGVLVAGGGRWTSPSGTLSATVSGDQTCRDVVPNSGGELVGSATRDRFVLSYFPFSRSAAAVHTHCAGPLLADGAIGDSLASGSVPLAALGHRTVTFQLRRDSRERRVGGYLISGRSSLKVTLRRTVVRRQAFDF